MATPMGARFGSFMRSATFQSAIQAINEKAVCSQCGAPTIPFDDSGELICLECAREHARAEATAVDLAVWDEDARLRAVARAAHDAMLAAERKARRARKPEHIRYWRDVATQKREEWQEACALRRTG